MLALENNCPFVIYSYHINDEIDLDKDIDIDDDTKYILKKYVKIGKLYDILNYSIDTVEDNNNNRITLYDVLMLAYRILYHMRRPIILSPGLTLPVLTSNDIWSNNNPTAMISRNLQLRTNNRTIITSRNARITNVIQDGDNIRHIIDMPITQFVSMINLSHENRYELRIGNNNLSHGNRISTFTGRQNILASNHIRESYDDELFDDDDDDVPDLVDNEDFYLNIPYNSHYRFSSSFYESLYPVSISPSQIARESEYYYTGNDEYEADYEAEFGSDHTNYENYGNNYESFDEFSMYNHGLANIDDHSKIQSICEFSHCTICADNYDVGTKFRIMTCGHKYCVDCAEKWFSRCVRCPLCNHEFETNLFNPYYINRE